MGLLLQVAVGRGYRLLIQPSGSAPKGLYWQRPVQQVTRGSLVVVQLPSDVAAFAADRGYLPRGVPVLKYVVGVTGHTVCWDESGMRVEGVFIAEWHARDSQGRSMPHPEAGCRVLMDEVVLLNTWHPLSYDSRYFGAVPVTNIQGTAVPVWAW